MINKRCRARPAYTLTGVSPPDTPSTATFPGPGTGGAHSCPQTVLTDHDAHIIIRDDAQHTVPLVALMYGILKLD